MRDLWLAFVALRRSRSFVTLTILTLAAGVGTSAAIGSIISGVFIRPLPYADPDHLVYIWHAQNIAPSLRIPLSGEDVRALRAARGSFEDVAVLQLWDRSSENSAFNERDAALMDVQFTDGVQRLRGAYATPNFFSVLGVDAAYGRTFDSSDSPDVVVLSHRLWTQRFGGDPSIIGRTLDLRLGRQGRNAHRYTIVGILPERFRFTYPDETEVWVALSWEDDVPPTGFVDYRAVARLQRGALRDEVRAEVSRLFTGSRASEGGLESVAFIETLHEHLTSEVRPLLMIMAVGAILVLGIACMNVALLVMARAVIRSRDMAIRMAVGASSWRIMRILLFEGAIVALAGSAGGVVVGYLFQPTLRQLIPATVPRGSEIHIIDPYVLGFTILVGLLTALVCGMAPIVCTLAVDLKTTLHSSSPMATRSRHISGVRHLIVATQVAVVAVLTISGGLLLHSLWRVSKVDVGFTRGGIWTTEIRLLGTKYYDPHAVYSFHDALLRELQSLPNVAQVSMTSAIPLDTREAYTRTGVSVGDRSALAYTRIVEARYFQVMSIPLLAGRYFDSSDTSASEAVAIVSESYARSVFGHDYPVGRYIHFDRPLQIIGVVGDIRSERIKTPPAPAFYLASAQRPIVRMHLLIQSANNGAYIFPTVRQVIRSIDPEQPVVEFRSLEDILRKQTATEEFYAAATTMTAVIALCLAMGGLFGVVMRMVSERQREIAIRIAIGAPSKRVVRWIVSRSMRPIFAGLILGMLVAAGNARIIDHLFFEITALDLSVYILTGIGLFLFSLATCYAAARSAARIDAISILNSE